MKKTNANHIQNNGCYDKITIQTKMNLPVITSDDYCFQEQKKVHQFRTFEKETALL